MPTTLLEGPKGFDGNGDEVLPFEIIGTSLGDGINYNVTQTDAILQRFQQEPLVSSGVTSFSSTPSGYKYFNFFHSGMPEDRQIPLNKVITGVEVVAGPDFEDGYNALTAQNSNIGSFGPNSGTYKMKCYLWNGLQYSAPLTWDSSNVYEGISFSENDTVATFDGSGRRYINTDFEIEGFEDVLFGGSNDLSGLNWDPANQSEFGLAFTFLDESDDMSGGFLRGIGLRITYDDPPPPPTKVKLKGFSPTIQKSLRSSENVNTNFSVGNPHALTTTNTPGTVTMGSNDANVFIGGVIGVRFNQVEDLNESTFNLSDVWDSITNIRTRFIYAWNSSLADNSNSFKIGWTGGADQSDISTVYDIVYNEETIFNTEANHDVPTLYTSNINGDALASLKQDIAGDLTKLRFIFRYNDDTPDNTVILYGQGSDGGAVPSGNPLENQASLEFTITYGTPINNKIQLKPTTIVTSDLKSQGPYGWEGVGNVGDFQNYSTPQTSYNNRLLFNPLDSTNGDFVLNGNTMPRGLRLTNFFGNSDFDTIPSDAEIIGVALLATEDPDGDGHSFIGSGGAQGQFAKFDMECYFYNGITYSDKLTWDVDNAPSGMVFFNTTGGTNNRARFTGPNVFYKNNTEGRDTLFGGFEDLSGLNWDPANQANFGFSMVWLNPAGTGTVLAGVQRGLTMAVAYQTTSTTEYKIKIQPVSQN